MILCCSNLLRGCWSRRSIDRRDSDDMWLQNDVVSIVSYSVGGVLLGVSTMSYSVGGTLLCVSTMSYSVGGTLLGVL
jgi:hypothetical protein